MTATDNDRAPLADAIPPDLDHTPAAFSIVTAQPAPRLAPVPLRTRAADLADQAIRSPQWDQVRGLAIMASLTVVGAALALLFAVTFLTGAVVLVRTMWEAMQP